MYEYLKSRQPPAQAELLDAALRDAHKRIDELERHGHLSESPALVAIYRAALERLNKASLSARAEAAKHAPKTTSAASVILYTVRHGLTSDASRELRAFTKLVRGVTQQLDYPPEPQFRAALCAPPRRQEQWTARLEPQRMAPELAPESNGNAASASASQPTAAQHQETAESVPPQSVSTGTDPSVEATSRVDTAPSSSRP